LKRVLLRLVVIAALCSLCQTHGLHLVAAAVSIQFLISLVSKKGNVEYKRQLHNCTAARLEKLKTQMSFRLDEGNGGCMYRIGVEDNGCHSLMDYAECAETAKVLEYLARSLNAVVLERKMIQNEVVRNADGVPMKVVSENGNGDAVLEVLEPSLLGDGQEQYMEDNPYNNHTHQEVVTADFNNGHEPQPELNKEPGVITRCELSIQRVETHLLDPSPISNLPVAKAKGSGKGLKEPSSPAKSHEADFYDNGEHMSVGETLSARNIRVAVVGNVDAGKSTMIGTLTSSMLDDGRGSSRTSIMKHRHEIESGRTSTASSHLMGFRSTGQAIAGKDSVRSRRKSEDEVARESYRVVTLMDLAGHEKYLKTT
jgi:Elongation factor Tu GTP binding domain